jgi:hypothetical protein
LDGQARFRIGELSRTGAVDSARLLLQKGIGIEAGLLSSLAADVLVDSELLGSCVRQLIEPPDATMERALRTVAAIEDALGRASGPPRLLHWFEETAWSLLAEARRRGYAARIGLEDVLTRPDGQRAESNAALVRAAGATTIELDADPAVRRLPKESA